MDEEQALIDSLKTVKPRKQTIIPEVKNIPPLMEVILKKELTTEGFEISNDMFYYKNKIKTSGKFNFARLASDTHQPIKLQKAQVE